MLLSLVLVSCFGGAFSSPSVIIIGAGPSGIAAATKLLRNGITDVKILEAEDRIGGRIFTIDLEGETVDVGGEMCAGEEGNIVYDTVKDLDLLEHSTPPDRKFYYSTGSEVNNELSETFSGILSGYNYVMSTEDQDLSLKQGFLKWYDLIMSRYGSDKKKIITEAKKMFEMYLLVQTGAFSWDSVAAQTHNTLIAGDLAMTWKNGGYLSFLKILMKNVPIESKIYLNHEVTKIVWNETKVNVFTENAVYKADHVIFTASLGVLKHGGIFYPDLPTEKQHAINSLGFDGVIKVVVHFPKKWWTHESFFFLWSTADIESSGKDFPYGYNRKGVSWITSVSTAEIINNRNALVVRFTGDMVPEIEKLSDSIIQKGVMFIFNKFLGKDYNVTHPDKIFKTQWYSNPHFRGTYSYERTGYFSKDGHPQSLLAEPLENINGEAVVQFAGEATHSIYFASVHGAVETGYREAERLLKKYNKVEDAI